MITTDPMRLAFAAGLLLLYLLLCGYFLLRHRRALQMAAPAEAQSILVAYASQTGMAENLAGATAQALAASGFAVSALPLGEVTLTHLAETRTALFIASTTGEGDAPDNALSFLRRMMPATATLPDLTYGLLALGDSHYEDFCGFGRQLDAWLRHAGASPLFDRIEVDDGDAGALRHWQHQLGVLSGNTALPDWASPEYGNWLLMERAIINPGSPGAPVFAIGLRPADGLLPTWEAGDIAEIGPRNNPIELAEFIRATDTALEPARLADRLLPRERGTVDKLRGLETDALLAALPQLPHRDYSIASLPEDGRIELMVRQMRDAEGRLGYGSGWLTDYAARGASIALRIRTNGAFHPPADERPLILIGNGTGMAGLIALLKARKRQGERRNWLIFGERSRMADYFRQEEIQAMQAAGFLSRVDLAFSRDQAERIYVQHKLMEAAEDLRRWVAEGAAIYVCGSLQGMAGDVDAALRHILTPAALDALAEAGRYRRDVY